MDIVSLSLLQSLDLFLDVFSVSDEVLLSFSTVSVVFSDLSSVLVSVDVSVSDLSNFTLSLSILALDCLFLFLPLSVFFCSVVACSGLTGCSSFGGSSTC